MKRIIFCNFFKKKLPGMEYSVYSGKLSKKIFNNISQHAWNLWIKKQTILINEKKLNMSNEKDRKKIKKHMKNFFFKKTNE
ncbi:oxidative damage protection protein [Buchnera aphidicola (Mollitrichosiphum nigrofasciatum)]|uniref:oxidative damage protection protein n=1 Tax=Buchnera aphidicola TaxID=9 RepID=UPI0031B856B2